MPNYEAEFIPSNEYEETMMQAVALMPAEVCTLDVLGDDDVRVSLQTALSYVYHGWAGDDSQLTLDLTDNDWSFV